MAKHSEKGALDNRSMCTSVSLPVESVYSQQTDVVPSHTEGRTKEDVRKRAFSPFKSVSEASTHISVPQPFEWEESSDSDDGKTLKRDHTLTSPEASELEASIRRINKRAKSVQEPVEEFPPHTPQGLHYFIRCEIKSKVSNNKPVTVANLIDIVRRFQSSFGFPKITPQAGYDEPLGRLAVDATLKLFETLEQGIILINISQLISLLKGIQPSNIPYEKDDYHKSCDSELEDEADESGSEDQDDAEESGSEDQDEVKGSSETEDDVVRIRILKYRIRNGIREAFVSWVDYPGSVNKWVAESHITDL